MNHRYPFPKRDQSISDLISNAVSGYLKTRLNPKALDNKDEGNLMISRCKTRNVAELFYCRLPNLKNWHRIAVFNVARTARGEWKRGCKAPFFFLEFPFSLWCFFAFSQADYFFSIKSAIVSIKAFPVAGCREFDPKQLQNQRHCKS
jgi:hypothetical protein